MIKTREAVRTIRQKAPPPLPRQINIRQLQKLPEKKESEAEEEASVQAADAVRKASVSGAGIVLRKEKRIKQRKEENEKREESTEKETSGFPERNPSSGPENRKEREASAEENKEAKWQKEKENTLAEKGENSRNPGRESFIRSRQKKYPAKTIPTDGNVREKKPGSLLSVRDIAEELERRKKILLAGAAAALVLLAMALMISMLLASPFGIFFSGETGSEENLRAAMREINTEWQEELEAIQNQGDFTEVHTSGSAASWKDVLSVYAVLVTNDPENAQDVVTMSEEKKELLREIYREMSDYEWYTETVQKTESRTVTVSHEGETDENGKAVPEEEKEEIVITEELHLYIEQSHRTAEEAAEQYGFEREEKRQLQELLGMENEVWLTLLYGISGSSTDIVEVALSQIGNVGGEPYWSWYGFSGRVEWCACFVSWCAEQCGYIEAGIIPKYALVSDGVYWFKSRNEWADRSIEPSPGMIIFFDWDGDGGMDHTGIVEKTEGAYVYTVEGNTTDSCKERMYPVGSYRILGYGCPDYG